MDIASEKDSRPLFLSSHLKKTPVPFFCPFSSSTRRPGTSTACRTPWWSRVYADRTFDFIVKSPPASVLPKDAAKLAKGSGVPNKEKVGKVTEAQIEAICKTKMKDLNCESMDSAKKIIAGTARSMGIEVEG